MTASATSVIHDWVREDRITCEQGAMLLQLQHDLSRARRPRWVKAIEFIARVVFS